MVPDLRNKIIDGEEIGIRKGIKVVQINIPKPACRICKKAIKDNLFISVVTESCDEGITTVGLVCDICRERGG